MPDRLDTIERIRRWIKPLLHVALSKVGLYAEYATPRDQYAATVYHPYPELEKILREQGFVRNVVSSLKSRSYAGPSETSVASWALYPDGFLRSDDQLHLALYVGDDRTTTDVYAHWEPSWFRHPVRHYRVADLDAEEGVRRMRRHLDEAGVQWDVLPVEERIAVEEQIGSADRPGPNDRTAPDDRTESE